MTTDDVPEGPDPPLRRRAIVVLGMHRSGTSAVTRVLNLLGAGLPRQLKPGARDNVPGFWEGRPIVRRHDLLLQSLGSSWDDVAALPGDWLSRQSTRTHEDALLQLLRQDFSDADTFAVKDPRASRLVPLWLRLLERFDADASFALVVRHPLEVARSLAARDGFGEQKSLLLWLIHLVEAERATRGRPRAFVSYERLLREPDAVVAQLRRRLEAGLAVPTEQARIAIREFLSDEHRHHLVEEEIASGAADLRDWVREAHVLARRLAHDEVPDGDSATQGAFDELARHVRTTQLVVPIAQEARALAELRVEVSMRDQQVRELRARNGELREKLRRSEEKRKDTARALEKLEQSLAWRLTAPLRSGRRRVGRS